MSLGGDAHAAEVRRLRVAAHPLRLRMMSLLTGAELSASEVARELGITQANASYHLRLLERAGALEVAGTERIRGGVAKKYRYTDFGPGSGGDDRSGGQPDAQVTRSIDALAAELRRRAVRQSSEPGLPHLFADLETWMEPQAWRQVVDLAKQAADLAHAQARPVGAAGAVPVTFSTVMFTLINDREGLVDE